jgi:uncharacterized membrane protein YheB (UPF0754 family)
MAAIQPGLYITKRDVNNILLDYVKRTDIQGFISSTIDNEVKSLDFYSKSQIDNSLSKYVLKSEINSIITDMTSFYTRSEVDNLITAKINFFKNNELNFKLENYVHKDSLTNYLIQNYYSKNTIEDMLKRFVVADEQGTNPSFNSMIASALEDYMTYDKVYSLINATVTRKVASLSNTLTTALSSYVTKDAYSEELTALRNSIITLAYNLETKYETTDKVSTRIHRIITNNFYTRSETKILIDKSIEFFRDNWLKFKLENYVLKDDIFDYLSRTYYTKEKVDELVEQDKFCRIKYISNTAFNTLKKKKQVEDNCIYVITKYERAVALYIGTLQFAKRDETQSMGFPYTWPIVF